MILGVTEVVGVVSKELSRPSNGFHEKGPNYGQPRARGTAPFILPINNRHRCKYFLLIIDFNMVVNQ